MARFPTYEEYKDRPAKGISKCDEILKRAPNDIQLLATKAQLLSIQDEPAKAKTIVDRLLARQPPIVDLTDLTLIEDALFEQSQADVFPQPLSSGPEMAKLWENAGRSSSNVNHKLDVHSLRFFKAIYHGRLQDAQQAVIQLKALQPKNRSFYMAHAAVTQMLSTSKEDLHARLALMLARKAVSDKFDEEKGLDVRVPGQIFALQCSEKDLEATQGRSFSESKQVHDALRKANPPGKRELAAAAAPSSKAAEAKLGTPDWLSGKIGDFKTRFVSILADGADQKSLCELAADATTTYRTAIQHMDNERHRNVCELVFVAISALVKVWEQQKNEAALLQASFLGEMLLRDNKNIHEAKVILIHLYMRLDLGSQAMKHWASLSIKEVQFDTMGHSFLTRLSIVHPHRVTGVNAKLNEPVALATHGLGVYHRCEQKLAETEASVLSHAQTGIIFDLHELRENLRLSLTRRILSLEQRSFARLLKLPLDVKEIHIRPRLTAQWLEVKDNRDFEAAFDYGYSVERILHGHDRPRTWLLYKLAVDTAWCLATKSVPPVKDTQALLRHAEETSSEESSDLTPEERILCQCARDILAVFTQDPKSGSAPPTAPFEALDRLDIGALTSATEPFPLRLRQHHTHLDLLRLLAVFCAHLAQTASSASKQDLGNFRIRIEDAYNKLQNHASDQRARLQPSQVQTHLERDQRLWDVLKASGVDAIRSFSAEIVEAAKSGWSGVGKIALP